MKFPYLILSKDISARLDARTDATPPHEGRRNGCCNQLPSARARSALNFEPLVDCVVIRLNYPGRFEITNSFPSGSAKTALVNFPPGKSMSVGSTVMVPPRRLSSSQAARGSGCLNVMPETVPPGALPRLGP